MTVSYIDEEHVAKSHIATFPLAPCFSYFFQNKKYVHLFIRKSFELSFH